MLPLLVLLHPLSRTTPRRQCKSRVWARACTFKGLTSRPRCPSGVIQALNIRLLAILLMPRRSLAEKVLAKPGWMRRRRWQRRAWRQIGGSWKSPDPGASPHRRRPSLRTGLPERLRGPAGKQYAAGLVPRPRLAPSPAVCCCAADGAGERTGGRAAEASADKTERRWTVSSMRRRECPARTQEQCREIGRDMQLGTEVEG